MPALVVELLPDDMARIELDGMRKDISLALTEGIAAGDYVIVHAGYALQKLDPQEAAKTLSLFAELGNRS